MSSTGAGYDYSCSQYSPDGKIFQVEYALKAVENSGTSIGIKCSDGVVMAVEKPQVSRMLVPGSNRRIFGVDSHIGIVVTGLHADGRQLVNRAREEAHSYKDTYGHPIVPSIMANRLALYAHYFTLHGSLRPFGSTVLFTGYDADTKEVELYMVDPSGMSRRYLGCSAGKGAQAANTEIEKLLVRRANTSSTSMEVDAAPVNTLLSCREAVKALALIMHTIRDPSKDKPFELEMCWCGTETGFKHSLVPKELVEEADRYGKASVAGGVEEEAKSSN